MSKLRLAFTFSLVILVGVFISTIFFIPSGQAFTESVRVQIIEGEEEWILQCDVMNNEGRDINYTISVTVDKAIYRDSTVVSPGKTYTYIHHIYPQQLDEGEVTLALYQEGKAEPIEQATYYLDLN